MRLEGSDMRLLIGFLVALFLAGSSGHAQSGGNKQISTSPMIEAGEPPEFSVRLISIEPRHSELLGRGVASAFAVTNHGTRDIARMMAQLIARNQDDSIVFKVEWDGKRAIRAGETLTLASPHARVGANDIAGAVSARLSVGLDIFKIAFADGETVSYKRCFMCLF
jgi:hypothetical protein